MPGDSQVRPNPEKSSISFHAAAVIAEYGGALRSSPEQAPLCKTVQYTKGTVQDICSLQG